MVAAYVAPAWLVRGSWSVAKLALACPGMAVRAPPGQPCSRPSIAAGVAFLRGSPSRAPWPALRAATANAADVPVGPSLSRAPFP
jgi:hypothetical protein